MQLIVGLGNPGKKYQYTRHNIGYMAIENIISAQLNYKIKNKFNSIIYEVIIDNNKIILVKPETYMNNSGDAVYQIANFYKINSKDIFVLHDELDIPFGKIRIKIGGGNAGHNGLKSITNKIDNNYTRVRLGIGHPGKKEMVNGHVMGNFSGPEKDNLSQILNYLTNNVNEILNKKEKFSINFALTEVQNQEINPLRKILDLFK
ncbi:MAG: aminoacyl-tRNA hydrolase [Hyphomicrobiales bacterium]|nr:MAG: aminoacyl-tRNA hydrolase [Hyphomicrobiales bacterium]|tara:strand:+ start:666 stop:1277 length:612 start_codon:yes stop_codon:yes gene_type:complete